MRFLQHAAVLSAFAIIAAVIVFAHADRKVSASAAGSGAGPTAAQIAAVQK